MSRYIYAVSALAVTLTPAGASWADGAHDEVMQLAEQKKFDAALAVLAAEDAAHQEEFDHRFLRARVLSWGGRYGEAQSVLDVLKAEFPENTDIDVAMGNLAYYQGNLTEADTQYSAVLASVPGHADATSGLESVRKAKAERMSSGNHKWRVDAGGSYSSFDVDAIEEWGEQYINVEHRRGDVALRVGANRYERFGATDTQLTAAISNTKREGVDWGLVAAVTPDADFRAKTSLGGHVGKAFEVSDNLTANVALHYRRDSFEDKAVQSVQPEVTTYFKSGLVLKGRAFVTKEENEDTQSGWLVEARHPVGERASVRIGYADAPEVINGTAVDMQSVFGGVSFDVADSLTFHISAGRSDLENIHVRNDVSVGITRKF